jgi:rhodanese-related sulfurtransferase
MKEINAEQAFEEMQRVPETIYLDVRSIPEFEQAHPAGAINIPLLHFAPGMGMMPNDDFLGVVEATIPRDARILVGCKTGGRSVRACELMSQIGYTNVTNVRGGFLGVVDNLGRVTEPGWSLLDLPICKNCLPDAHYDALSKKSKKH